MNFIVQTENNEIMFDFQFQLIQSVKFNNWYSGVEVYSYRYVEGMEFKKLDKYSIPVGSVEFVTNFYKRFHGIESINPINIPRDLHKEKYLKRKVFFTPEDYDLIDDNRKYFLKSNNRIKGLVDIVKGKYIPNNTDLLVSETIEIIGEWRCFVHNKEIKDIRNYGDRFDILPDIELIKEMIKDYKNSPKAYTLDVALTDKNETVLIEVHQMFSCGLYGYNDNSILRMYIETHNEILTEAQKK